ncbi:MAG TPA: hypothetical protein VN736_11240 [Candidatus Limnocylindrales bacterium]|nr:hypothetical protein [Candidatus Limnocylindrales bacterium]
MRKLLFGLTLIAALAFADFEGSYVVPLDHAAIQYKTAPVTDRAFRLQQELHEGKTKPEYDSVHGYLNAVLKALHVPESSQVLVYSKTSFQAPRIAPRLARAIYFTDDAYVGWVPGGDVVEIASVDPRQGVIFYTMDQDAAAKPRIDRRDDCLQCHASGTTAGVPGLMVRSVFVDRTGMPLFNAGGFVTDHRSPLSQRWGGWYVTGTHGSQRHMGNVFVEERDHPDALDREKGANVTDLHGRIDIDNYLAPSSDIVALMVLEHQTRMTNLITRAGWEVRVALSDQKTMNHALKEPEDQMSDSTRRRIDNAAETLLKYVLFTDEALLDAPVKGSVAFTRDFQQRAPRDHAGRSLRDLDLTRRMFRYPCSFLIYSEAFDSLPREVKDRFYHRLLEVLNGTDQTPVYSRLTAADRKAIYEILLDTKMDLPSYWRSGQAQLKQ